MEVLKKATTVKNVVSGFHHTGIFPWNPTKVEDKKFAPSEFFKKDELMPDVNMSVNEARGEAKKNLDKEVSGSTQAESKSPEKENEALGSGDGKNRVVMTINPEGMINEIVIDGVKYRMVPLGDGDGQPKSTEVVKKTPVTMNETKKMINEMLTVLSVPKKKTSSCHVSGIPRCISLNKFQEIMKKKEKEKKELKEAKEEHKGKCLENAKKRKDVKKR